MKGKGITFTTAPSWFDCESSSGAKDVRDASSMGGCSTDATGELIVGVPDAELG